MVVQLQFNHMAVMGPLIKVKQKATPQNIHKELFQKLGLIIKNLIYLFLALLQLGKMFIILDLLIQMVTLSPLHKAVIVPLLLLRELLKIYKLFR